MTDYEFRGKAAKNAEAKAFRAIRQHHWTGYRALAADPTADPAIVKRAHRDCLSIDEEFFSVLRGRVVVSQ